MSQTEWRNVTPDFSGTTGLMNAASNSVKNASNTVSDIFKSIEARKQAENQQKLAQDRLGLAQEQWDFTRQKTLEEEAFDEASAEAMGNVKSAYIDWSKTNPKSKSSEFMSSEAFKGVSDQINDPEIKNAIYDTAFEFGKKRDDAVTSSLDRIGKEKAFAEEKEYNDHVPSLFNDNLTDGAFKNTIKNASPAVKTRLIKERKELQKINADLNHALISNKISKANYATLNQQQKATADLNSKYSKKFKNTKTLSQKLSTLSDAIIEGATTEADISKYLSAFNQFSSFSVQNGRISNKNNKGSKLQKLKALKNYTYQDTVKDLKGLGIQREDVEDLHGVVKTLVNYDLPILPNEIYDVAKQTNNLEGWDLWGKAPDGEGASKEIAGLNDITKTDKDGTTYFNLNSPMGKGIFTHVCINLVEQGKDFRENEVIKASLQKFKARVDEGGNVTNVVNPNPYHEFKKIRAYGR